MFIARTIFHPAPGQSQALRSALEGLLQPDRRSVLSRRLWGPMFELRIGTWYESLADVEKAIRERPPTPQTVEQFKTLLAVTPGSDIDEVLVQAPQGPPPEFVVRFEYHPAQGKVTDLRQALEERVRALQADGRRVGLSMRVSGGPQLLSLQGLVQDLGTLEAARAQALADPAAQEFSRSIAAHLARPADTPHIYHILTRSQ